MRSALPIALLLAAGYVHTGQSPSQQGAASFVILGAADTALTIDWLDVDAEGRVSVIATRSLRPAERLVVPAAASPRRLLRFSRPGMSPVTMLSTELPTTEPWHLPPPARGGELIVLRSGAVVVPQRYRLFANGTESTHEHGRGDFMMLRAVPAGSYQLTPIYPGGVAARAQTLRVDDGQSTFVFVPKEDVGGAAVKLHPSVCSEATRILIRHLSIESTKFPDGAQATRTLISDVTTLQPVPGCEPVIGGLTPGEYELVLDKRQSDAQVRRRFEVRTDVLTDLVIEPARTRLSGKVTLNGRHFDAVTIEFRPEGQSKPVASGRTDERGTYTADFDKPGPYYATLRLRNVPLAGQQRLIEVPAGETTFDWAVIGGALTVRIDNVATNGGYVWLYVDQKDPPVIDGRSGFFHSIRSDDPELAQGKLVFPGMAFAGYEVRATQQPAQKGDRTRASRQLRFAISERDPSVTVTLVLVDNFGQIVLTNPAGAPIAGARIYSSGASARETEPGIYSMDGVPPGLPLNIRATGYTPLCRLAPETTTTVVLDAGRTVEVQFPGIDGKEERPWGWLQWSGSDCRVALDAFPFTKLPTGADGVPRFAISHFPHANDVGHSLGEPMRPYQVLYGVLVIPVKK
jgi:hypothetical protein